MFRFIVASRMFGGLESEYSEAEGQDLWINCSRQLLATHVNSQSINSDLWLREHLGPGWSNIFKFHFSVEYFM